MLIELARRREEEEARALASERRALELSRGRAESLGLFREDYDEQARGDVGHAIGAIHLKSRHQLVEHLDLARGEAVRAVEEDRRRVTAAEDRWRERRTRSGALAKAAERIEASEARARRRGDQRRLDEFVAFAHDRGGDSD